MFAIKLDDCFQINNENPKVCSKCGGKCCKSMGCHYSPTDFTNITFETLKQSIDKGYISIDWWEGDVFDNDRERTYFLRIRNKKANIVDPSWGGECVLLTEQGCSLSFNERPMGGRALTPGTIYDSCINPYSKEDCCQEWYPYQDILERLVYEYQNYVRM